MKLACGDCYYFVTENPEPVKFDFYNNPIYIGRCYCYGYYLQSNDEICTDFKR